MSENNAEALNVDDKPSRNRIIKYLLNILLFLVLIYLTFHFLLKGEDLGELKRTIRKCQNIICINWFFMHGYLLHFRIS